MTANINSETLEGFLAYFDLLGFSNKITKEDFTSEFSDYCKIIDEQVSRYRTKMFYNFFSDSVIIYTNKIDIQTFSELVQALNHIFFNLVNKMELSLRGAVSCGKFTIHKQNGNMMIAGQPMVDAYYYEEHQNWIGIMISPTVTDTLTEIFNRMTWFPFIPCNIKELEEQKLLWWYTRLYYYNKIPWKNTGKEDSKFIGYVIIPRIGPTDAFLAIKMNLLLFKYRIEYMKVKAPDTHVQKKYLETEDFLKELIKQMDDFYSFQIRGKI